MDKTPSGQPLPAGMTLIRVLAERPSGSILLVEEQGEARVLRFVDDLGGLSAQMRLLGHAQREGLALPTSWGQLPGGGAYVTRPFLDGPTLKEAAGTLDGPALLQVTADLLEALAALHDCGLLHRDIKPENVILVDGRAHLIDLDLADTSGTLEVAGTKGFLSPELLIGAPATTSADLFSLGITLIHGAGLRPDRRAEVDFPRQSYWEAARLDPSQLPQEIRALVIAVLHRWPNERPADARVALDLTQGAASRSTTCPVLPNLPGETTQLTEAANLLQTGNTPLLISVRHPEETSAALHQLHLAACQQGMQPECLIAEQEGDLSKTQYGHRLVLPTKHVSLDTIATDVIRRATGACAWILEIQRGEQLHAELLEAGVKMTHVRLGGVSTETLEKHLLQATASGQPESARLLAEDLVKRTDGRVSLINEALRQGVEVGAMVATDNGLALKTDRWPGELVAGDSGLVMPEDHHQRDLLLALAALGEAATLSDVALVIGVTDDDSHTARAELARSGWIEQAGSHGSLYVTQGPRLESVQHALDPALRKALSIKWLQSNAPLSPNAMALLRLKAQVQPEEVLEAARQALSAGRMGWVQGLVEPLAQWKEAGEVQAEAVCILAQLQLARGDHKGARATLSNHFGTELSQGTCSAWLIQGEILAADGQPSLSANARAKAQDLASDSEQEARVAIAKAYAAFLEGNGDEAEEQLNQAPNTNLRPETLGTLHMLQFAVKFSRGDYDAASEALKQARTVGAENIPSLLGRIELNQAVLARRQGNLSAAISSMRASQEAFGRCDNLKQEALAANNLGVLLKDSGDLTEARKSLTRALRLRRRLRDQHAEASSLGSLALVDMEAGHLGSAGERLALATRILERGDHQRELDILAPARALFTLRTKGPVSVRSGSDPAHLRAARTAHRPAVHRFLAEMALSEGRPERAQAHRLAAVTYSAPNSAEAFRSWSTRIAHEGSAWLPAKDLKQLATDLAPVRKSEMQWRLHAQTGDLETDELNSLLHIFQAGGRSDLVAAVARNLIRTANQRADPDLRRRSTARFEEASRAILRGLEGPQAKLHLERTLHLAGNQVPETPQDSNQDVDWLLECIRRLASSRDRRELLERILDHALERTGARRGYVVIARNQEIETSAARGMELDREDSGDASISSSVIHAALADSKPISTANAAHDERFQDEQSVRHLQLRSVLCVPFADQGVVRGAIYVDNDRADSIFDDDDIRALSVLADPAAVALAQIEERQRIKDLNRQLADKVEVQESELVQVREALKRSGHVAPLPGVIGTSPAMLEVAAMVERLAPTDLTVLVTGPSGSGKELIARALHHRSNRADGPLITENTAALPESLLESELFGHKKGAFTGAEQDREGLFKRAQGGTLFLDEIGDLPLPLQVKLLRVLESGEVRPLGSNETETVSVRVVAATHQQLTEKVQRGEFREDLFYRLNGGEVSLPALEERLEDLPLLVAHFMEQLSAQYGQRKTVSDNVLAALLTRAWPGQVRELRNEVARLWFLCDEVINNPALIRKPMDNIMDEANKAPESMLLIDAERIAVERALSAAGGRRDQAAKLLGISRSGLYTKLTRLGLD